jgi:hypothetical protein
MTAGNRRSGASGSRAAIASLAWDAVVNMSSTRSNRVLVVRESTLDHSTGDVPTLVERLK